MSHALPNFPEPTWTKAKGDFSESYSFHVLGLSLPSRPLFHREIGRSLIMNENRSGWLTTPVLNYLIIFFLGKLSWSEKEEGEKRHLCKRQKKKKKRKKLVLLITSLKYTCCWMLVFLGLEPGFVGVLALNWIISEPGTTKWDTEVIWVNRMGVYNLFSSCYLVFSLPRVNHPVQAFGRTSTEF